MSGLKKTALHGLHLAEGAKMVPFAGWEMPVQFPMGVMKEHLHTRTSAGVFDVSHMGQVILRPATSGADPAEALERLVPADIAGLPEGRQRYALFTADDGGILDDLMVANRGDHLFVVVNAACREADLAHMRKNLPGLDVIEITDRALLAVQGPAAAAAVSTLVPGVSDLRFMDVAILETSFGDIWVSRSGYTGEDGFEISVPEDSAERFARSLLELDGVAPVGLGARDSLRLEAGLCLYGTDIDETTTPIEADLAWSIGKARRRGGSREGGFTGAGRILDEMQNGPARRRVGLLPEGRAPMRAGTPLFAGNDQVGSVTSGSFGASLGKPISMGYVASAHADAGTQLEGEVRGRRHGVTVAELPFVNANFKR